MTESEGEDDERDDLLSSQGKKKMPSLLDQEKARLAKATDSMLRKGRRKNGVDKTTVYVKPDHVSRLMSVTQHFTGDETGRLPPGAYAIVSAQEDGPDWQHARAAVGSRLAIFPYPREVAHERHVEPDRPPTLAILPHAHHPLQLAPPPAPYHEEVAWERRDLPEPPLDGWEPANGQWQLTAATAVLDEGNKAGAPLGLMILTWYVIEHESSSGAGFEKDGHLNLGATTAFGREPFFAHKDNNQGVAYMGRFTAFDQLYPDEPWKAWLAAAARVRSFLTVKAGLAPLFPGVAIPSTRGLKAAATAMYNAHYFRGNRRDNDEGNINDYALALDQVRVQHEKWLAKTWGWHRS